jgi:predicted amidophosphoribosyltransferase
MKSMQQWTFAPHVCRHCLGRIVKGDKSWVCSTCGVATDRAVDDICGCGIRPTAKQRIAGDLRTFRCAPNPKQGPNSPSQFAIMFGDEVAEPPGDAQ